MIRIDEYHGDRGALRPLFELADDSPSQLDAYIASGRVLVALDGEAIVGHLQLTELAHAWSLEVKNMAVLESHQRRGIGQSLVRRAAGIARDEDRRTLVVATAAADIGNLRFYQRLGFRMLKVERDAFTEASGYEPQDVDGIPLCDRVWLDMAVAC
jgi:predicted N-acetyltransferase YhbS